MQIILYVLLLVASFALFDPRQKFAVQQVVDHSSAVAMQMATYHKAAVAQCSSSVCPAGPISVQVFGAGSAFTSGMAEFISVSDGVDRVMTYWSLPTGTKDAKLMFGNVAASLRGGSLSPDWVGYYDPTSQSVAMGHPLITDNGTRSSQRYLNNSQANGDTVADSSNAGQVIVAAVNGAIPSAYAPVIITKVH